MLCGVNQEKVASVGPPRSPASTAGNSTPPISTSSSHFVSSVIEEVAEDVLIIGASSWTMPLVSAEDIARLCRCISKAHEAFAGRDVHPEPMIAWRLFQAADSNYNGYVTSTDLQHVLISLNPRLSMRNLQAPPAPLPSAEHLTLLYWDALMWWTKLDISDADRRILESGAVRKLVVASDGLWAGLNLSALLRVWKTVCRSAGYLFRYEAMRYVESAFLTVRRQEMTDSTLFAELEVVMYLISESVGRVGKTAARMWSRFAELDSDGDGKLSQLELQSLLTRENLRCTPTADLPISRSTSGTSSLFDSSDDGEEKFAQYSMIQILDAMLESCEIVISSKTDCAIPGRRVAPSFSSKWSSFWRRVFRPSRPRPSSRRTGEGNPDDVRAALTVYLKLYFDLEQWRGQKLTELSALASAPM